MSDVKIMLGNEAIARGAYEAGVKVSAAYPGTPSTEISENIVKYKEDIYAEWSPNEKVATETAAIFLWSRNSIPLSVVIVSTSCLKGISKSITA